ncbi:MAG TPA: TRAP transporter large permease [Pseudolabrys sp.]|nr:TRAP transporter large permease [Pseudolabrys sp.]
MSPITIGLLGVLGLMVIAALRAPIGLALIIAGFGGLWALLGLNTALFVVGNAPITAMSSYTLSVLPLFVLMGTVAVKGGLAESIYRAAYGFIGHRRGGLAMASIMACGGFGSICGSSVATVSTLGRVAIPEMLRYGYSKRLAAGSLAAGGTLGILIPPSVAMIIYAMVTQSSLGRLFAAGIIPGIIATAIYCAATAVWMQFNPAMGPAGERTPWPERLRLLRSVGGIAALFAIVMGGIFAGFFSPTEGASVGAFGAIVIGFVQRSLTLRGLFEAALEAIQTSMMILFAVIGISVFEYFVQAARVPQAVEHFITALNWGPTGAMMMILAVLILLGCFLDSIAILFIVTPVIYPIVTGYGYDAIWFGIIMVMVVEFGLITPPFGMNVFVLTKIVPGISTRVAFSGVTPYILADFVRIGLLLLFPQLVVWLPNLLYN